MPTYTIGQQVHCCFGSKLARIFHEQGRPQVGRGWGDAKNPDCGALSVDEISRMDFSSMNFSEIFADVFQNVNQAAQKAVPSQMQDQMPLMQKDIEEVRKYNKENWSDVKESKF